MIVTEEVQDGQLAELLKQVQAGNEVLLTEDGKIVAKLISIPHEKSVPDSEWKLKIRSIKGHRVLKPDFTHAEIADEMFGQKISELESDI